MSDERTEPADVAQAQVDTATTQLEAIRALCDETDLWAIEATAFDGMDHNRVIPVADLRAILDRSKP